MMEGSRDGNEMIIIRRNHLPQVSVDENSRWSESRGLMGGCLRKVRSYTDHKYLRKRLFSFFPVIPHLMSYQWRSWLLNDVIAGISVASLHIPQGLGLAMLAGVPPVYGLYTSFIPLWVYYIFGSCRHLSLGTTAVAGLMVGSYVNSFDYQPASNGLDDGHNSTVNPLGNNTWIWRVNNTNVTRYNGAGGLNASTGDNDDDGGGMEEMMRVNAAALLTLTCGIIQLLMWLFNFSRMSYYMSTPFVKSFIAGCAVHIIINQLPFQLGISISRAPGHFQLPMAAFNIYNALHNTNVPSLLASVICMVFLFSMRFVTSIERIKNFKVPIPVDLILVITSVIISHFSQLNERFAIKVVGTFASGFPSFRVPRMSLLAPQEPPTITSELLYNLIAAGIAVAIVDYAFNITMAKLMAERNGYEVDADQEMMAYGLCNGISAFFCCHVSAQAPPRTLILETCKSKSQLASLISTIAPLIVAVLAGFLVASLPICVLGSIISASLIPLFLIECLNVRHIWKISRRDFVVWVTCFLATVFIGLIVGLLVGMLVNGWMVLVGKRNAKWVVLERFKMSELFTEKEGEGDSDDDSDGRVSMKFDDNNNEKNLKDSNQNEDSILPLKFSSSLGYTNSSIFKDSLMKIVRKKFQSTINLDEEECKEVNSANEGKLIPIKKAVILDFSCISDIDMTGLNTLKSCVGELEKMGIIVAVSSCPQKTKKKLYVYGLYDVKKSYEELCLGDIYMFPSIIDAHSFLKCS